MDVRDWRPAGKRPLSAAPRAGDRVRPRPGEHALGTERTGQILGEWQARELRIARSFAECRGLSSEQLEDIYQETALALLRRPHQNEEHLRNALRTGIKHRALNLHRDERRRGEILAYRAPELSLMAEAREAQSGPELSALVAEDRSVVSEFLTELTATEQRVFWLIAEGMGYRAIAGVLGIAATEARNASRSAERKRERFQLFYDTGRLCGFRASTILALQNGQATSEQLAQRAFAHLEGCARCRAEHKTNARRLRRSFQGQAAALAPFPALLGKVGWLTRVSARARVLSHRITGSAIPSTQGSARERAAELLAGGGAAAKVAAGLASLAVVAGGAVGATHLLAHPRAHRTHHASSAAAAAPGPATTAASLAAAHSALGSRAVGAARSHRHASGPGHVVPIPRDRTRRTTGAPYQPGGFAYLGVPTSTSSPASAPAQVASNGGGLFSP
jgi:RNA polymerase sigma factor (sigma-70 family)